MSFGSKTTKPGRNDACYCGSGKKYKKCHGSPATQHKIQIPFPDLDLLAGQTLAQEKQREKQQGLGCPIISTTTAGRRFVAVGSRLHASDRWKTFHDFLFDYVRQKFGWEWMKAESQKPEPRHPLVVHFERVIEARKAACETGPQVKQRVATGIEAFLLDLAYSLYLLEHNAKIQTTLLDRMRRRDHHDGSFYAAFYETFIAGVLIRAGYSLEFENEDDPTETHCEFTATCIRSGRKFSVEAKRRIEGKAHLDVGNQLRDSLRKKADHDRLVFIEVNVDRSMYEDRQALIDDLVKVLDSREALTYDRKALPPAYVIVTNSPYLYHPNDSITRWFGAHGYKIPDLKVKAQFADLKEMIASRDKHREVLDLMESFNNHLAVPSTFDGEIPEFAFGDVSKGMSRLIIGNTYNLGDSENPVPGVLRHASVIEDEKSAFCVLEVPGEGNKIYKFELTDAEITAYRSHPETFFGKYDEKSKKQLRDPLDLYDWLHKSYSSASKEQLLKNLQHASDIEELKHLSQEELVSIFCQRTVYGFLQIVEPNRKSKGDQTSQTMEVGS
jgi:SEC-C motif